MKKISAFLILFMVTFSSLAQKNWDSTYRPKNYLQKVESFREAAHSKKDIVFLGNSITAGTNWQELLRMEHARNRGISGDITFGILERLDEVVSGKPAKLFLLIGINDISRNIPDSVIVKNLEKIVQAVKANSPRTKIYLQTLLPVNAAFERFKNHYYKDEHIAAVNAAIFTLSKKYKTGLIDLHKHFSAEDGTLQKELTHDGLHLTKEGYQLWAHILKKGRYLK